MPRIATLADLDRLLKRVPLPGLSAEFGEPVEMTIRRIHEREYFACLPPLPADAATWNAENAREREAAWLASLPDGERERQLEAALRSTARIVALGVVEPALTWRQAETLHHDADVLATAILRHSGLLAETPVPAEVAAAA
jgi:hypothetical protein